MVDQITLQNCLFPPPPGGLSTPSWPLVSGVAFVVVQWLSYVLLFRPHGLQRTRLPCPSLSPGVCSNSCPLSWWCHPTICHPLLLLPSIFPSIRVFANESALHIMWPKYWSFSFKSVLPVNVQGWFPLGLTGLISLVFALGASMLRDRTWSNAGKHLCVQACSGSAISVRCNFSR